jgi:RIO kinase 1
MHFWLHPQYRYHKCKLVHGDLSEYNMLYHNGEVVIIDVSQSVEHDHPHAAEFLRKDCANVNAFFGKGARGALQPMSTRQLYDFIVDSDLKVDLDTLIAACCLQIVPMHIMHVLS